MKNTVRIRDIMELIEQKAPLFYQESYDNAGLQVGNPEAEATGALICLDVTEAILDEAKERGCNLIIAHHPLIFPSIKRLVGKTEVERILMRALREDIHIYAAHTNLDNVRGGVNDKLADKLDLHDRRIMRPMRGMLAKICVFVPPDHRDAVQAAVFAAGAGELGEYSECSFHVAGTGSFRPGPDADPFIGEAGGGREEVTEHKLEFVFPVYKESQVVEAMLAAHPYEEAAYDYLILDNRLMNLGAGLVGRLPAPMDEEAFLRYISERLEVPQFKHTPYGKGPISKVGICGGSGAFLIPDALGLGVDAYLTGDIKYHQFFEAQGKMLLADLGHYETERFTGEIFKELINEKFPNFASLLTSLSTNPIKYYSHYGHR